MLRGARMTGDHCSFLKECLLRGGAKKIPGRGWGGGWGCPKSSSCPYMALTTSHGDSLCLCLSPPLAMASHGWNLLLSLHLPYLPHGLVKSRHYFISLHSDEVQNRAKASVTMSPKELRHQTPGSSQSLPCSTASIAPMCSWSCLVP